MPDHRQKKLQKHKKKRASVVRRPPTDRSSMSDENALQLKFLEMAVTRPMGPCFVTKGWDDESKRRVQCVVVTHVLDDGLLLPASFLVDLGCEGIKDAFPMIPVAQGEGIQSVLDKLTEWFPSGFEEVPPHVGSAIVIRAMEHAEKLGFMTSPKSTLLLAVLDSSEAVRGVEVPVGRDGKPIYSPEPEDDTRPVIQKLAKALGPDGFLVDLPPTDA